jgi:hypothetical protein
VAEVFRSRSAALNDRDWRNQQVRAYADWLIRAKQPRATLFGDTHQTK